MRNAFIVTSDRVHGRFIFDRLRQLRDLWSVEIHKASTVNGNESGERVIIDVCDWLSKMTLDVIGLAGQIVFPMNYSGSVELTWQWMSIGFNYSFNALNSHGKPNELNEAVRTMFRSPGGFGAVLPVLQAVFPPLRIFVNGFSSVTL